jgi:RNA polymerase sigma factor (sigma-70 family)
MVTLGASSTALRSLPGLDRLPEGKAMIKPVSQPHLYQRGDTASLEAHAGHPRWPREVTPYERHRRYVLAVLARRCRWLDPTEHEALLHEAYALFLEKQRDNVLDVSAMSEPQVRAYLTQTALNKALDEGKRASRRRSVPLEEDGVDHGYTTADEPLDDVIAARADSTQFQEIVADLPDRQQAVIELRFIFDRTPSEIQSRLGIGERVYRRELERGVRAVAERYETVRTGTFCESRRSTILAWTYGIAGPKRAGVARRHVASCSACTAWVAQLREAERRGSSLREAG